MMPLSVIVYTVLNNISTIILATISLYLAYILSKCIYNIYFHPLSSFPGPKLSAATDLTAAFYAVLGKRSKYSETLHAQYGDVVRTRPDGLSFIGEHAWKDIYMHRQGHKQMAKAGRPTGGVPSILNAGDEDHARQRRLLGHAFSERALRDQEAIIQGYVDLLISNLRDDAEEDREIDLVSTFNLLTFDIVSDLSFGESFDGLRTRRIHPWITAFFEMAILRAIFVQIINLKITLLSSLAGKIFLPMARKRIGALGYTKAKILKRLAQGSTRPDFMSHVLRHNDQKGMSTAEIQETFTLLILAGSETTATLLAGCMFLLQTHPNVRHKLEEEIRQAFEDDAEIVSLRVNKLGYLNAVIGESLRRYPPVPIALDRMTPAEGTAICGQWVPGNVTVGIPQFAAYTSPLNFTEPLSFIPERHLPDGDTKFDNDKKAILQPFSAGPRNCIGKNLAMVEMKLILAKIVFNFDFELVSGQGNWLDQDIFTFWRKRPLLVRVRDVRGGRKIDKGKGTSA